MAQKKNFKNPAMQFISTADAEEQQEAQQQEGVTIPKGYKLVKENKSERMQLLVRPATKEAIKKAAAAQGLSMNDLVNNILDEYAERQGQYDEIRRN
jgi:predicted HicB family RNase H-like nuclease